MSESFLIRTIGGPYDNQTRVVATSQGWSWPLPDELAHDVDDTGRYVKASESTLPPQCEGSRLMRGVQYEWQPAT